MLILICRIGNRLEYLPGVCRIRIHTYASIEVFEDPIGLAVVDCGSSGSVGMLHLSYLLPFFDKNVYSSLRSHLKVNLVELLGLEHQ